MVFFTSIQQIFGYLLLLILPFTRGQEFFDSVADVNFECRNATDTQLLNEELTDNNFFLTASFIETRTFQDEPLEVSTIYFFDWMRRTDTYNRMENLCTNRFNYDMCFVTSVTNFVGDIVGAEVPFITKTVEYEKPLCVPKSCSDDQAQLIDPNIANCFPEIQNCELESYEVDCPEREITDTAFCTSDVIPPISTYNVNANLLYGQMLTGCADEATGGSSTYCNVEFGTFSIETEKDYSNHTDVPAYLNYEETCLDSGGQICSALIEADYTIPSGSAGTILLTKQYIDYPICVPTQCGTNDEKGAIIRELFPDSDDILIVDCASTQCKVAIKDITCSTTATTASPTLSPRPSASPSETLTQPPSDSTSQPSSIPSLPVSSPTGSPTPKPSPSPTIQPLDPAETAAPLVSESSSPTVQPPDPVETTSSLVSESSSPTAQPPDPVETTSSVVSESSSGQVLENFGILSIISIVSAYLALLEWIN